MKKFFRLPVFFLFCLLQFTPQAQAAEKTLSLQDAETGYFVAMPEGWQAATKEDLRELIPRLCSLFTVDGVIPGAAHMQGAFLPGDEAAPALLVFALDYSVLGLPAQALEEIAQAPQAVVAALANALQTAYLDLFPQSILVNSHLGEDFFSLHLRTVLDFADEAGSTRNRYLKICLASQGAVVFIAQYDGFFKPAYESIMTRIVRESVVAPEKTLPRRRPPYQASLLDYALLAGALFFVVFYILKLCAWMRR